MTTCQHNRRQGDNYGISCQDCGEQLEGYGCGGFFGKNIKGNEKCIHTWNKINDIEEQCIYCEALRERKHKAN